MTNDPSNYTTRGTLDMKTIGLTSCLVVLLALAIASAQPRDAEQTAPVEEDMHEFMEYVFQPTYLRLKNSMAALADNQADWKAIKSDALILAEATNLLLHRGQSDDAAWKKFAIETRQAGATFYAAAKQSDPEQARAGYVGMLARCNACHDEFTGGEPKLVP
jgi:hypothetical protein